MVPEWVAELLSLLAVVGAAFCLGVSWAAYRAVGWVERIRSWAAAECEASIREGVK